MTRYNKKNGKYSISGKTYPQLIGTRAQVWHDTAYKTSGGLTKNNLTQNKAGRIVSKAKHSTAKREKRLIKHGYGTKKGKFGFVKLNGTRKTRGGAPYGNAFSPASNQGSGIDGQGITDYSANGSIGVQLAAGQAGGGKGYGWLAGSGIDGQGITNYSSDGSVGVQMAAGLSGGRRRKGRGRSRRGGAPYGNAFRPASSQGSGIDGQGITDYSANGSVGVQLAAGQAGGRRRKGRGRSRRGGTTKPMPVQNANNPLNAALGAS